MSIVQEETRPSKKVKLSFFRPFAPSGAVSASRSSALMDDEYLAKVIVEEVTNDDIFFPPNVKENRATVTIGKKVQQALGKNNIVEETLRNAIYTDLKMNHGIQFPSSSERWRSEIELRKKLNSDFRYKETDLAHLLNEFYENQRDDGSTEEDVLVLERILYGLNVTTTSLPDMTVLRDGNIVFGEFKNSEKYSLEHATKQCTLYLYALLYFFRVRLGMPVKAVFGFVVCGCGCFGNREEYAVGFVRLSSPEKLGSPNVSECYAKYHKINDDSGIQNLVHFLKSGKIVELGTSEEAVEPSRRIPALLTLPETFWESELLVTNGTASMVFKGNAAAMLFLLDQFDPGETIFYPGSFRQSAVTFFEGLADRVTRAFYLKIRLKNTTLREFPAATIGMIAKRAKDCYQELYCVDPVGDANFGIFLMNDCGTVLHRSETFAELGYPKFLVLYRDLWMRTTKMCEFFLHGDALPHNLVYNEDAQKLVLIDLDEGTYGAKAPKRVVERVDGLQYQYLRYPNFYRAWTNRTVYTQLQLVASFLLILPLFEDTSENQMLISLRAEAAAADSFLKDENKTDPSGSRGISESVTQVITRMQEVLEPQASS